MQVHAGVSFGAWLVCMHALCVYIVCFPRCIVLFGVYVEQKATTLLQVFA